MIPQFVWCKLGRHDWFQFWLGRLKRRRCIACGSIQQRAAYPGEHWYQMDRQGRYRIHN